MSLTLIFKFFIVLLLIAIFVSLGSGIFFLVRDQGKTKRTVKSLTIRIILSAMLFLMLFIGYLAGIIKPHGINSAPPSSTSMEIEKVPP